MKYCTCGASGSVYCPGSEYCCMDEASDTPDVCVHGRAFDEICVECCPEDDDGSFTGDEWS